MDFIGARTDAAARSALSRMGGGSAAAAGAGGGRAAGHGPPRWRPCWTIRTRTWSRRKWSARWPVWMRPWRPWAGPSPRPGAGVVAAGRAGGALRRAQCGARAPCSTRCWSGAGPSSRTSRGTTRDVLREELSLRGLPVVLSDTAGLRRAEGLAEEQGVALAKDELSRADLGLLVLDSSLDELPELPALSCPLVVALNKGDLPARLSEEAVERALHPSALVRTCALTGEGVDRLREALYELAVGQADVEDAALAGEPAGGAGQAGPGRPAGRQAGPAEGPAGSGGHRAAPGLWFFGPAVRPRGGRTGDRPHL